MAMQFSLNDEVRNALRRGGAPAGWAVREDPGAAVPTVFVHYPDDFVPSEPTRENEDAWKRGREARLADCRRILEQGFAVESIEWQGRDALRVTEIPLP